MSAPVVATGHFCWPWPGAMDGACAICGTAVGTTWVRTRGKVRSHLSMSLWDYSRRWREAAGSQPMEYNDKKPSYICTYNILKKYLRQLLESGDSMEPCLK